MGFWHFGKINAHLREYETYAHMYSKPPEKKNHRVLTQNSKHVIDSLILLVINPHCFGIISQQQKTRLPILGQRVRPWHPCHIFPVAVWRATMFDPNYPVWKCFLKRKVSCNSICQKALLWLVSFMERVITTAMMYRIEMTLWKTPGFFQLFPYFKTRVVCVNPQAIGRNWWPTRDRSRVTLRFYFFSTSAACHWCGGAAGRKRCAGALGEMAKRLSNFLGVHI